MKLRPLIILLFTTGFIGGCDSLAIKTPDPTPENFTELCEEDSKCQTESYNYCREIVNKVGLALKDEEQAIRIFGNTPNWREMFVCKTDDKSDGFTVLAALENTIGGLYPTGNFRLMTVSGTTENEAQSESSYVPKEYTAEYPAVGVLKKHDGTGSNRALCTATLIGPSHLLTAAHCIVSPAPFVWKGGHRRTKNALLCMQRLALSFDDSDKIYKCLEDVSTAPQEISKSSLLSWSANFRSRTLEPWSFELHGSGERKINSIAIHPHYGSTDKYLNHSNDRYPEFHGNLFFDIAVLELDRPIDLASDVTKLSSMKSTQNTESKSLRNSTNLKLIGYGASGNLRSSNDIGLKKKVLLRATECPYKRIEESSPRKQFGDVLVCWEFNNEKSVGTACGGDSGGPVLLGNRVIGVVSGSSQNACTPNRWRKNDRSIPETGYGSLISPDTLKWIRQVCSSCRNDRTFSSEASRNYGKLTLSRGNKNSCDWSFVSEFSPQTGRSPLFKTELPARNYRQYRLCSTEKVAAKLSVTLRGTLGSGFDEWRPDETRLRDLNLYVRNDSEIDRLFFKKTTKNFGELRVPWFDVNGYFLGDRGYNALDDVSAKPLLDCVGGGASVFESCNLDYDANSFGDTSIVIKREFYEGPFQVHITKSNKATKSGEKEQ